MTDFSDHISTGDAAQTRAIAEQVADAAISRFVAKHPEVRTGAVVAEIPAPLKWAAGIFSAIITMAASAGIFWLVTSVNDMGQTLVRMDERMAGSITWQETRMVEVERRIAELEKYHRRDNGDAR